MDEKYSSDQEIDRRIADFVSNNPQLIPQVLIDIMVYRLMMMILNIFNDIYKALYDQLEAELRKLLDINRDS